MPWRILNFSVIMLFCCLLVSRAIICLLVIELLELSCVFCVLSIRRLQNRVVPNLIYCRSVLYSHQNILSCYQIIYFLFFKWSLICLDPNTIYHLFLVFMVFSSREFKSRTQLLGTTGSSVDRSWRSSGPVRLQEDMLPIVMWSNFVTSVAALEVFP